MYILNNQEYQFMCYTLIKYSINYKNVNISFFNLHVNKKNKTNSIQLGRGFGYKELCIFISTGQKGIIVFHQIFHFLFFVVKQIFNNQTHFPTIPLQTQDLRLYKTHALIISLKQQETLNSSRSTRLHSLIYKSPQQIQNKPKQFRFNPCKFGLRLEQPFEIFDGIQVRDDEIRKKITLRSKFQELRDPLITTNDLKNQSQLRTKSNTVQISRSSEERKIIFGTPQLKRANLFSSELMDHPIVAIDSYDHINNSYTGSNKINNNSFNQKLPTTLRKSRKGSDQIEQVDPHISPEFTKDGLPNLKKYYDVF
ncbi:Hypothetical_protein [Hexamita inflata]|uniref:Hypothetical_protein n=1 Tax=Hexamita inflata TaxID=28002 RepID=A0ABP1KRC2_9EUKA